MTNPKLRCQWCSRPFVRANPIGPIPKFCKASCRQHAFIERRINAEVERRLAKRGK